MNNATPQLAKKLIAACRYIEEAQELPSLSRVADHVRLSPAYFQKIFTQALGVSPRHYGDALRFKRLRRQLRSGEDISAALYGAGFGATSRVYEFAHRYLGMTPKVYMNKGKGCAVHYTIVDSPLGFLLLAATEKGICLVQLGESKKALEGQLKKEFKAAQLLKGNKQTRLWVQALIDYLCGHKPWPLLPYDVRASAFQRRVWEGLRLIPSGETRSYSQLARAVGKPKAVRAAASACAANPVALVVPCHRIVPKSGGIGGYRWHPKRKRFLLDIERRRASRLS